MTGRGKMLRTVTAEPYNAEAPLGALGDAVTDVACFFVRNNFPPPDIDAGTWRLRVSGAIDNPIDLSLAELQRLPRASRRATLECAGNGRQFLRPAVEGTAWRLGAAGTADFEGVRLRDVLAMAGVHDDAVECVFTGADGGSIDGMDGVTFQRSLPVATALSAEPLLCWLMNGAPLTREHGHPVRLVVPGYYAVASVKWLTRIELVRHPFHGYFQTDRYMYRIPGRTPEPVTVMRVRALVTSHTDGEVVAAGEHVIRGVAWSGAAAIQRVEVSLDRGAWLPAEIVGASVAAAATRWCYRAALDEGRRTVRVRAIDAAGTTQPLTPQWNELGYGNNVVHTVGLDVTSAGRV